MSVQKSTLAVWMLNNKLGKLRILSKNSSKHAHYINKSCSQNVRDLALSITDTEYHNV
jgi:hypothetical protein